LLEALQRFPGTVVLVSHDRHILNQLVTQVIEVGHGSAVRYLGNYDEYLEKKAAEEAAAARISSINTLKADAASLNRANGHIPADPITLRSNAKNGASSNGGRSNGADRKALQTHDRDRARKTRRRTEIEAAIEEKENGRAELTVVMNDPQFYLVRKDANELIARYELLGREIEQLYEELVSCEAGEIAQ